MKTYADLTDEQFIELHCLAWNIPYPTQAVVSTYFVDINVWQVRDQERRMTEFDGTTGEVIRLPANGVWNLWTITATCKKWGVDYSDRSFLLSETDSVEVNETINCIDQVGLVDLPADAALSPSCGRVSLLAKTFYVQIREVFGMECQQVSIQLERSPNLCFRLLYTVAEADYLADAMLRLYELAFSLSELASDESVSVDIAFMPISKPNLATSQHD